MNTPLIELQGISFGYPERPVLRRLDLVLGAGERLALVGDNGAGKSTLLHLIVGLKRPSAGRVIAFGRERRVEADFYEVRAKVGLLFQDSDDQLFCPTVLEDVAFGPLNLGYPPAEARRIALKTLEQLSLTGFADRIADRLSAGEKRLVALASVLAMRPEVLLLDEPTNGLDRVAVERLIAHLSALSQAMILVSHDWRFLGQLVRRALCLKDGRLSAALIHAHAHDHHHSHPHLHRLDELGSTHTDQPFR
ncbi:ABC transporter ATP-binding protein [Caldichromatium japonicum]|uniref:ABC transporter ATP-binding protein n=1 Tax=Caldichromatium japonicum TaxID=2699430 RepID=A0A6G7VC55_9GAMM|nr:ABC transporter ATP-binding protein [Caldichromatium japonicum]QIK37639.1 ABC transporter ATP-binding protein [Caldichromatium japonicum]